MFKLDLEKAEEPKIKLPTYWIAEKGREELPLEQRRLGCGSRPEAWIPQHTAVGTLSTEPEHRG